MMTDETRDGSGRADEGERFYTGKIVFPLEPDYRALLERSIGHASTRAFITAPMEKPGRCGYERGLGRRRMWAG